MIALVPAVTDASAPHFNRQRLLVAAVVGPTRALALQGYLVAGEPSARGSPNLRTYRVMGECALRSGKSQSLLLECMVAGTK